jgi:hypothetical protein
MTKLLLFGSEALRLDLAGLHDHGAAAFTLCE